MADQIKPSQMNQSPQSGGNVAPMPQFEVHYDRVESALKESGMAARRSEFPKGPVEFAANGLPFAKGFEVETLRDNAGRPYKARPNINDAKVQKEFSFGWFSELWIEERKGEAMFFLLVENVEGNPMSKYIPKEYFGPDGRCFHKGRYLCGADYTAIMAYRKEKASRRGGAAARLVPKELRGGKQDSGSYEIDVSQEELSAL